MQTFIEHEAKILNVDIDAVRARLENLGAQKILEDTTYMEGFEFNPESQSVSLTVPQQFREIINAIDKLRATGNMFSQGAYLRLRREGSKYELIFKQRCALDSVVKSEVEISVLIHKDEWDTVVKMLESLGLSRIAVQEKKRISYEHGDTRYDVDTWPGVPPYVEVEAPSAQAVLEAVALLGFADSDAVSLSAAEVFKKYGIVNPLYLTFAEAE